MTPAAFVIASLVAGSFTSRPEPPASHLWVINELFSDPGGTVQFIEMWECCGSAFETHLTGKSVFSDATGNSYTFSSDVVGNTAHRYLLLGTATFAALPGAPTPDAIIPDQFFSINGDTIRWHVYPNATLTFGPGVLPVNGLLSLNKDGTTGVNTPTNFAGQTGTVNISTTPAMPAVWFAALVVSALLAGALVLRSTRPGAPAVARG